MASTDFSKETIIDMPETTDMKTDAYNQVRLISSKLIIFPNLK